MPHAAQDGQVQIVKAAIIKAAGRNYRSLFLEIIRQGLDEVIDGGRTGRWCIDQLEKTEKTYIGTKLEILVRNALEFDRGRLLDLQVAGHEVDIKSTVRDNWMIPKEAFDEICLLIRADERKQRYSVGLLRMTKDNRNLGENRDAKVSVSSQGKSNIDWIIEPSPLPLNFLASLSDDDREAIFRKKRGQARVTEFLRRTTGRVIPRLAIETLAQQKDPMKRIRSNGGAQDKLLSEGIVILVGDWVPERKIAEEFGLPSIKSGEVVALKTEPAKAASILLRLGKGR